MSTLLPAIPEPQSASLPALLDACEAVVQWAEMCEDIGTVREVYDKFAAIAEYLTRRDAAREAAATMRRLEVRIGQLLPSEQGRRTDLELPSRDEEVHTARTFRDDEKAAFRQMAAHTSIVDEVIAQSTQTRREGPGPASRAQILARIAEKKLDEVKDAIRADTAAQARADREEMQQFARSITPDDYDPQEDRHSAAVQRAIHAAKDGIAHLYQFDVEDVRRALNHSNPKVRNIVLPAYTEHLRTIIDTADRFRELLP